MAFTLQHQEATSTNQTKHLQKSRDFACTRIATEMQITPQSQQRSYGINPDCQSLLVIAIKLIPMVAEMGVEPIPRGL